MIAASLREGDEVVDMLLGKEADVNAKSTYLVFFSVFGNYRRLSFHEKKCLEENLDWIGLRKDCGVWLSLLTLNLTWADYNGQVGISLSSLLFSSIF